MAAKSRICKWGSSLAVHIPKPIPKQRGLHEGSAVEMVSRGNQVMLRQKNLQLGRHPGDCDGRESASRGGYRLRTR